MRRAIGERLLHIRAARTLPQMAQLLGVSPRTYAYYEQGDRVPDGEALARIVAEGWNMNWLLTGVGPERLADVNVDAGLGSQSVIPAHLTIALELADEKLARDKLWLPRADYAELVVLILQRLQQGWAYPRIRELVDAALSRLSTGEDTNAGGTGGLDTEGAGAAGKGKTD